MRSIHSCRKVRANFLLTDLHKKCKSTLVPQTTDLLSTSEAAGILCVTVATVNRWAATGKLVPAHQIAGRTGARLFAAADVDALAADVNAKRIGAPS